MCFPCLTLNTSKITWFSFPCKVCAYLVWPKDFTEFCQNFINSLSRPCSTYSINATSSQMLWRATCCFLSHSQKCPVQFGLTFWSYEQHFQKTIWEHFVPRADHPYHQTQRGCTAWLMPKVCRWSRTCCRSCQCSPRTGWAPPCLAALWQNETQQPSRTSACAGISTKTTFSVVFQNIIHNYRKQ